ncbi:MAG TPA: hypothetical protein VGE41_11725 [Verrucomicrobiae bacterium]|jgi:arylsulfatase
MIKNIIIGALAFSNIALLAMVIVLCVKWRALVVPPSASNPSDPTEISAPETGPQQFTFKGPSHLPVGRAPRLVNRSLSLTASFSPGNSDGVIVAQGGTSVGYSLYVQNGELLFAVRRLGALTQLSAGMLGAGQHTATAAVSKDGDITLALDGHTPAPGKIPSSFTAQPNDGLDIGADRGAPVGAYAVPNLFGGTIGAVNIQTSP